MSYEGFDGDDLAAVLDDTYRVESEDWLSEPDEAWWAEEDREYDL